jgi:hypothetical protein
MNGYIDHFFFNAHTAYRDLIRRMEAGLEHILIDNPLFRLYLPGFESIYVPRTGSVT